MTSFDRIEARMPDLMGELAPARVPDYFDDLLRQTTRTRQRPAWSSPERWLPMGVIARIEPARQFSWRPIVVVAILIVALSAALALYAGSQRSVPLPPPFGPAANGDVLISRAGDILALDLATGITRPVIATNSLEEGPVFAPDGRSFFYLQTAVEPGFWVADADGSNAHRVFDTTDYLETSPEWSQSGDRLLFVAQGFDGKTVIAVVDPDGGEPLILRPDLHFNAAAMPYGRDQLVLSAGLEVRPGTESHQFWLMDLDDPANPRLLPASPFALNALALSPDGSKLVYATWEDGVGYGMSLRILDLDTNEDRLVTTSGSETYGWQHPEFLPDGTSIVAHQWGVGSTYQLGIVPADGGTGRGIGPMRTQESGGSTWFVSPDGKTIVASYKDDGVPDGKTWQVDVASGVGTELSVPEPDHLSWQRVGG